MIDIKAARYLQSSKTFNLVAQINKQSEFNILNEQNGTPGILVSGYKFSQDERIRLTPTQSMSADNIYLFSAWAITHNVKVDNLAAYAANPFPNWILYENGMPVDLGNVPFCSLQENEMHFVYHPNNRSPVLEIGFNALIDGSDIDLLNLVNGLTLGIRFTVSEIKDNKTVNEWLARNAQ